MRVSRSVGLLSYRGSSAYNATQQENDNQIVKELHAHFSPKKALALLYKLESETRELVAVGAKIAALADEFRQRW